MKVRKMMERNVIFFERGEKAREAAAKMLDNNIHQLVLRDGRMITAERMIDERPEPWESIGRLARNYGHLSPLDKDKAALRKIISAGVRALPVMEDGEVVGVLGRWNFLDMVEEVEAERVASYPVITVSTTDDISKAWKIMRERKVSALPVLNGQRMEGILRDIDMLKTIARADKKVIKRGPVSNIMEGVSDYFEGEISFGDMLAEIKRFGAVVITQSRRPVAIVTEKDLVERLLFEKKSYAVELVGITDPLVEKYVGSFVEKVDRLTRIHEVVVHSKPAKGMKEIKVRVYTDMGNFIYTEVSRSELSAVQQILDRLESMIIEKKRKIRKARRKVYWELE